MTRETLLRIVEELSELYQRNTKTLTGREILEGEMRGASAIEPDEPHKFIYISLDCPYLENMSSRCGKFDNRILSKKPVIDHLRAAKVPYILALIHNCTAIADDWDDAFYLNTINLASIAMQITEEAAEEWWDPVQDHGGSFRYDPSRVPGWGVFESE